MQLRTMALQGLLCALLCCFSWCLQWMWPSARRRFSAAATRQLGNRAISPWSWFRDFAMLDVYALACVVVLSAVTALNNDLHLRLLPAGWVLCSLTVPWVVFSWARSPKHERLAKQLRATPKAAEVVAAVAQTEESELKRMPVGALARALTSLASVPASGSRDGEAAEDATAAQIRLLAALREVNKNEEEAVDIPAPELLQAAEKVLDLGGDDPDETVLVQRTAAARVLAGKALKGAVSEGGLAGAGFSLMDVPRLLALPGAAGRDVLLATSCVELLAAGSLQQQRDVLRVAAARSSTNTAAAAGTAILKTLAGQGGPADHVAATDACVETVCEVAQAGVRLPAAAALLRRMSTTAKPVKLAETLLVLAQKAGPGQADDLQAVAEILASKDSFHDFTPELLLEAALLSSKHDFLESLAPGTAAAAASILEKLRLDDVVKLLLAVARRRGGLPAEVKDTLRVAAETVLTPQLAQLGSEDLAGLVLATLGHGWKELREAVAQELLRRLPAFPAKQLLVVTPVFLQEPTGVELISSWPKVLSRSTPPASSQKTSAQDATDTAEGLAPDQLVKLANLAENEAAVAAAPKQWKALLEDISTRMLSQVVDLSAAGRAMMSSQLQRQIGLGSCSHRAALQKALAAGVLPVTAGEDAKSKKRAAVTPAGPDGRLSKKQRGKQTRSKKT
eukprot:s3469_g4.t1